MLSRELVRADDGRAAPHVGGSTGIVSAGEDLFAREDLLTVRRWLKSANGLFEACLRAFSLTFAKVSFLVRISTVPRVPRHRTSARWQAPARSLARRSSPGVLAMGLSRSSYFEPSAPFSIFSNSDNEHALGDAASTACLASMRASTRWSNCVHVEDRHAREATS